MLSERAYWVILTLGLSIFIIIDLIWIMPLITDLGMDLLTSAIFTVFTIVFLTWVVNYREERQWKVIGRKIRERIGYRLFKIFSDISAYFLEIAPNFLDDLEKKVQETGRLYEGIEREKAVASSLVKHYANTETVELGEFMKRFLKQRDKDVARYLIENFKRENDFLEHIVCEYSGFLPPYLMDSLMEIEDSLDEIINVLWVLSMSGAQSMIDKKKNESILQSAIHEITKEINRLNEKNLGFSL